MGNIVLEAIKSLGPISAKDLSSKLALDEKSVRGRIDRLREAGTVIWHDPELGAFWFRDDQEPGTVPHERWKRRYTAEK
ncbi:MULTISPECIES: HTH domain-containing protein [unclassified Rhizobium]|uniref:HTH domain-containing protein n=1 Tax=unclassified Rhizobium TaxID=2613769 RepID=UPI00071626FC|nr:MULTISPECIES: HTH domain-containing protein [unclassified Rhizobium]KQS86656.1 hypothetical protein ASG50_28410 [Rhizobium sp. Leaf386]KQS94089.1 hypothetical protein ASG42_30460 [Rhizobium sp. Leaf391]KQT99310.1 hypothetical protein ASG68_29875 [Rhizobium sp. Leaf453]